MSEPSVTLPPIPDTSGEPRPPAAPRIAGPVPDAVSAHHEADEAVWLTPTSQVLAGVISDEERARHDANPVLETVVGPPARAVDRVRESLLFASTALLLAIVGVPLVLLFGGWSGLVANAGMLGLTVAGMFVLIFVFALAFGAGSRPTTVRASAHILEGRSGAKVWLYELSAITVRDRGGRGPVLRLESSYGEAPVTLPLSLLESNPPLWDLVHNGLRHSAARGARVNARARELLKLPR